VFVHVSSLARLGRWARGVLALPAAAASMVKGLLRLGPQARLQLLCKRFNGDLSYLKLQQRQAWTLGTGAGSMHVSVLDTCA
jgi:hypothetical protein